MKRISSIKMAKKSDLPRILDLLGEVNLHTQGVTDHIGDFLQLMEEGKTSSHLLGRVGLEIYGESALLRSLAVKPEHQGMGYGKSLTKAIIQYAKKKKVKTLFLLTDTAESFFTKAGFKRVERDAVPPGVKQSVEFTSVCPVSSACMMMTI